MIGEGNGSEFKNGFAIYVGDKVSLAHGAQVHGPAYIGNDTFVGMKSFIFNAKIGKRVAIGVSSTITDGIIIHDDKFIPPGTLHVNQELAKGYNVETIQRLAIEMEDTLEQEEMLQTGSPTGNPDAGVAAGAK